MNKSLIFIAGLICGILITVMTNHITDSVKELLIKNTSQPVLSNQVETSGNQSPEPSVQAKGTGKSSNDTGTKYIRYWESNGIKFKDVGENGIEKTYVWNATLKEWVDTGCIGYLDEN